MTVFEEENKGKRSRLNREVIIYSLLKTQMITFRFVKTRQTVPCITTLKRLTLNKINKKKQNTS